MTARSLLIVIMAYLLAGCSAFGIRSEYEQPPYVVLDTLTDQIEVRRYAQRLSVETTIDIADYNKSRNAAFELLFGYISGNNQTNDGVAMVSPVEVAQTSVEVAMTAPVETSRTKTGGMRMRFFLPAEFTLETAPQPMDSRVRLVEVTAQWQAVLYFSGFANEDDVVKRTKDLLRVIDQSSWRTAGNPLIYSYDPPWTIPFFRRNEVVVPVVFDRR